MRVPRFLTQNKGFSACVIFSLGVGISVASAGVAVVDSARNGPVPFVNVDRIEVVYVGGRPLNERTYSITHDVVRALADSGSPFEDVAMWQYGGRTIRDKERDLRAWIVEVTPSFPRMLSARMHIGRPFGVADSPEERYLMLSHGLWTRQFRSDSTVVGLTVSVNDVPHVITGVAAPEWSYPEQVEAWASNPAMLDRVRGRFSRVSLIGLRKPGLEVGQARAMISTIGTAAMTTRASPGDRIESHSLRGFLLLNLSPFLFALGLAALFIGFITAVNFAGLVLARGLRRRGEIAVRAALGASVGRLVRQIVAETVWLSAAGGVLAAMLAPGVVNLTRLSFASALPAWLTISLNWRIVAASVVMSLIIGIIFAIGPALDLARPALGTFLRAAGTGLSAGGRAQRSRAGLVAFQVGLASAFLVLFGALLGPALVLTRPDPGYDYASIITGFITRDRNLETSMYAVLASTEQTVGVSHAALVQTRWLEPHEATFEGAAGDTTAFSRVWAAQTSERFFDIVRPRLVAGRLPTSEEYRGRAPVAVVSEVVARRTFDGQALGKTIRIGTLSLTVIGVVEKVERNARAIQPAAAVISPIIERPDGWTYPEIWLRVGTPESVQPVLRDLQQRAARGALGGRVSLESLATTMRAQVRAFWAVARIIFGIFGIAMVLAAMGIYGLVSYTVDMRNREMAIREALGASRARVAAMLLKSAVVQTMIGLSGGALLATALARAIREHNVVLNTAAQSTALAFVVVSLTVLLSSFGPLRATWRRDLSQVLRD